MSEKTLNRRRWLLGSASLLAFAGCSGSPESSSGGGAEDGSSGDGGSKMETDVPSTPQSAEVPVGEVVEDDTFAMVIRDVSMTSSLGTFQEADSGNEFVVVRMAVLNQSDEFLDFSGFWQTRVKDADNRVYESSFSSTDQRLDSGTLAPGEVTRGDIAYEIPTSASGLTLQLDFDSFDLFKFNRVVVDLEEEASSIGDVEQDLRVDIRDTGESISQDDVSVTVLDVRTTDELSQFATADEGNEYVIPDIEVQNNTDEPLNVSTLLQMRVKTGQGFTYLSDLAGSSELSQGYTEGSEIAPGEARSGELAFEVPTDSSPLYFVFDFYSFRDAYKGFWQLR